jgi:hypothetical protein
VRARYAQMLALHGACEQDLLARGHDDAQAMAHEVRRYETTCLRLCALPGPA